MIAPIEAEGNEQALSVWELTLLPLSAIIITVVDIYSVKEAAQKMGISERHLRLLLADGQIEGKKLGHDWVVLSLDYKRKRRPKGGQSGEKS